MCPYSVLCISTWLLKEPIITSDKGGGNAFGRVRLSVCLSVSKITQKRVDGFGSC